MKKTCKIIIFIVTVLILLFIFVFPQLYSYMFAPVSILIKDIAVGDDYEKAHKKVSEFVAHYNSKNNSWINKYGFSQPEIFEGVGHESNRFIRISQNFYGELDDLHVTIYFDNNMKVIKKTYRGD